MKKAIVLVLAVFVSVPLAFSAIITNTNQSTQYLRLLARNASTDIDAVYYNPAGLTKLADGFHLAVHNETISQDKTVINSFPSLITRLTSERSGFPSTPTFMPSTSRARWRFPWDSALTEEEARPTSKPASLRSSGFIPPILGFLRIFMGFRPASIR